jgi:hypothetical protein
MKDYNSIKERLTSYWSSIQDFFLPEPLFGRRKLYSKNIISERDKTNFKDILGDFVTNLFYVVFTSRGVSLVNKNIGSLEKAVAYT